MSPHAEGHIFCKPATLWLKRYFVLDGPTLRYYSSQPSESKSVSEASLTAKAEDVMSINSTTESLGVPTKQPAKRKASTSEKGIGFTSEKRTVDNPKAPRTSYTILPDTEITSIQRQEVYISGGLGFKSIVLYTFTIHFNDPALSSKRKTLHVGCSKEEDAVRWCGTLNDIVESASQLMHLVTTEPSDIGAEEVDDGIDVFHNNISPNIDDSVSAHQLDLGDKGGVADTKKAIAKRNRYRIVEQNWRYKVLEDMEDAGTFIILSVVHGHPHTVFEEFQLCSPGHIRSNPFSVLNGSYIEEVNFLETNDNRDIVHITYSQPFQGCNPREVVLERYWRLDNGTYTLIFNSTEHDQVPHHHLDMSAHLCNSVTPVRMKIQGGITISAQKESEYGEACLVHYVVKFEERNGLIDTLFGSFFNSWTDPFLLDPFKNHIASVHQTIGYAKFRLGALTVMDRLAQVAGEQEAKKNATKQLAFGVCIKVVQAATKFRKLVNKKKGVERKKGVSLASNVSRNMWYDPGSVNFMVRGPDYFNDRKKIPAVAPLFQFVALEIFDCPQPKNLHLVSQRPEHNLNLPESQNSPFTIVVNLMIPGPPNLNVVMYFRPNNYEVLEQTNTPFGRAWKAFMDGDDAEKNSRVKMIPSINQGSWLIKQAVGNTPVIIGQKLETHYFHGNNYMEIDIDISCSKVACKVTGMCLGQTKSLVVDLGFVIEPHEQNELPECLLGTVRLKNVDLSCAQPLQVETKKDR